MALLNNADAIYFGDRPVDRMYSGSERAWPAWTPADLFANGEQGAWYDPSDLSTLYQDFRGMTPVTAVGQPVGLMLDRRFGLARVVYPVTGWARSTGDGTVTANGNSYSVAGATTQTDIRPAVTRTREAGRVTVIDVSFTPTGGSGSASLYSAGAHAGFPPGGGRLRLMTPSANSSADILRVPAGLSGVFVLHDYYDLLGNHATQPTTTARPVLPVDGPPRLRSDWVDDVISVTLPVGCEVWVNTPHGHYRAHGAAGLFHLPLNDCTHFLAIDRELSPSERDLVAAYFGTPARWGCYLTPGTEVGLNCHAGGSEPDPVIHFAGENGVMVTKTWTRSPTITTIDLADDGLTAPVMVMPDAGYGSRYFYCNANQLTGSIPDLSSNTALTRLYYSTNQLTGSIPDLSANTALVSLQCDSNQFTGYEGGGLGTSTNDMRFNANALPQEAVDLILSDFVDAGNSGTRVWLHQGTNSPPSAQGMIDVATLQSRGWNVQVNT